MILLDTNVISELMKAAPDLHVLNWLDDNTVNGLFISSISHAEIALGIALLPTGKRQDALALAAAAMFSEDFSGMSLPFDQGSTGHYAKLVTHRTRVGLPISTEDAYIAAIALNHGFKLATRNVKDFVEIAGLILINPWTDTGER
jgi:predicted nucleic acid-binding protein